MVATLGQIHRWVTSPATGLTRVPRWRSYIILIFPVHYRQNLIRVSPPPLWLWLPSPKFLKLTKLLAFKCSDDHCFIPKHLAPPCLGRQSLKFSDLYSKVTKYHGICRFWKCHTSVFSLMASNWFEGGVRIVRTVRYFRSTALRRPARPAPIFCVLTTSPAFRSVDSSWVNAIMFTGISLYLAVGTRAPLNFCLQWWAPLLMKVTIISLLVTGPEDKWRLFRFSSLLGP